MQTDEWSKCKWVRLLLFIRDRARRQLEWEKTFMRKVLYPGQYLTRHLRQWISTLRSFALKKMIFWIKQNIHRLQWWLPVWQWQELLNPWDFMRIWQQVWVLVNTVRLLWLAVCVIWMRSAQCVPEESLWSMQHRKEAVQCLQYLEWMQRWSRMF